MPFAAIAAKRARDLRPRAKSGPAGCFFQPVDPECDRPVRLNPQNAGRPGKRREPRNLRGGRRIDSAGLKFHLRIRRVVGDDVSAHGACFGKRKGRQDHLPRIDQLQLEGKVDHLIHLALKAHLVDTERAFDAGPRFTDIFT